MRCGRRPSGGSPIASPRRCPTAAGGIAAAARLREQRRYVRDWVVHDGPQDRGDGGWAVPRETYDGVARFLDGVFISDAKGYGYQIIPNQKVVQVRPALTAEALLCRQYLGWPHDDPRLLAGVELLFEELPFEFRDPHRMSMRGTTPRRSSITSAATSGTSGTGGCAAELTAEQVSGGQGGGQLGSARTTSGGISAADCS